MTAVALPPLVQDYQGIPPADALAELRAVIEHAINNDPRSLQRAIGPSGVGEPCTHCLAADLAGWDETSSGDRWLTAIGRAVHHWLEDVFTETQNQAGAQHTTGLRWLPERRIDVGTINGTPVTGSSDLFDVAAGLVVDWKITSTRRMPKGGRPPAPVYRAQAHLYGRGYSRAGLRVEHVAIAFLPRDAVSLDSAVWWHEPYDEQRAIDALDRAAGIARNLAALEQALGPQARDAWITGLPREEGCFSCLRYPDAPAGMTRPGHRPGNDLAGLIPQTAA